MRARAVGVLFDRFSHAPSRSEAPDLLGQPFSRLADQSKGYLGAPFGSRSRAAAYPLALWMVIGTWSAGESSSAANRPLRSSLSS